MSHYSRHAGDAGAVLVFKFQKPWIHVYLVLLDPLSNLSDEFLPLYTSGKAIFRYFYFHHGFQHSTEKVHHFDFMKFTLQ